MPDILRVTTPIIDKSQQVAPKMPVDATRALQIHDPSRVIQTHNQTDLMNQNTNLLEGGEAPTLLMNLLRDPAVTVTYLKNIFLLEEIFKLLPANNRSVTPEIEQMFHQLLVGSGDILPEMLRQENAATAFRGELFDFLRTISENNRSSPDIQITLANLLKSINNFLSKEDVMGAVTNSLMFLRNELDASGDLSYKLDLLIQAYNQPDAKEQFQDLKRQTLNLFSEIEESILFSPKLSKVISITIYNLSRFNDNLEFFGESLYKLRQLLSGSERRELAALTQGLSQKLLSGETRDFIEKPNSHDSRVMDALIKLIGIQSGDKNMNSADSAKVDKILHSLLSSPCNFTPLFHFIIPVVQDGLKAFAEIWINPESEEGSKDHGGSQGSHFLLVLDVEGLGMFEVELFVYKNNTIDFSLFCPPDYEEPYKQMIKGLYKIIEETGYRLGETRVETLNKSRSLMDVFKTLPYKRVGVDVRI